MSADALRKSRYLAWPLNFVLARKPRYVIVGTGRCGTAFSASLLTQIGISFGHEEYFTCSGPKLRNHRRSFLKSGDVSWLAVPFLPDEDMIAVHQVRHPLRVILSFYNIGFFDPAQYQRHKPFVDFASQYFVTSKDPLRSCLRWYLEWNSKCEQCTTHRFQVEELEERIVEIAGWFGYTGSISNYKADPKINSRRSRFDRGILDIRDALRQYPEFPQLEEMTERYGYTV